MKREFTPEEIERLQDLLHDLEEVQYIFLDEGGVQLDVEHFETPKEAMEHAKTFDVDTVDVCIWIGFVDRAGVEPKHFFFMEGLNAIGQDARSSSPKS